jgi:two-component system cell cycle sensor histidine kinase/response regulator CckA
MKTMQPSGKGRILLMDDEEGVRAIAGRTLEAMGYAVDYAVAGQEAVDLYRLALQLGERYAAVILDLNVPGGMGGMAALAGLRAIDPSVRAFVCSGFQDDPVMLDYAAHGFSGAIAKPFRYEDMVAAFRQAFGGATGDENPGGGSSLTRIS